MWSIVHNAGLSNMKTNFQRTDPRSRLLACKNSFRPSRQLRHFPDVTAEDPKSGEILSRLKQTITLLFIVIIRRAISWDLRRRTLASAREFFFPLQFLFHFHSNNCREIIPNHEDTIKIVHLHRVHWGVFRQTAR